MLREGEGKGCSHLCEESIRFHHGILLNILDLGSESNI